MGQREWQRRERVCLTCGVLFVPSFYLQIQCNLHKKKRSVHKVPLNVVNEILRIAHDHSHASTAMLVNKMFGMDIGRSTVAKILTRKGFKRKPIEYERPKLASAVQKDETVSAGEPYHSIVKWKRWRLIRKGQENFNKSPYSIWPASSEPIESWFGE